MHCDTMVRNILPPMRAEMVFRLVQERASVRVMLQNVLESLGQQYPST